MSFEETYFSGARLYGDDFTDEQLAVWFEQEKEACAEIDEGPSSAEGYGNHELNRQLGFDWLRRHHSHLGDALGLGSGLGGEWLPIVDLVETLTIIEPSLQDRSEKIGPLAPVYVDPVPSGIMPFDDESFDFVLGIGVLHHIANVSTVLGEVRRVLRPGGLALLREPIVTMGDWRRPRSNLSPNERGIPLPLFTRMIAQAGLVPVRQQMHGFPLTHRIGGVVGVPEVFNSKWMVRFDRAMANALRWNYHYHATRPWQKFRPLTLNVIAQRGGDQERRL